MATLRAYPQTEREAQQIHTIAFVVLLAGERTFDKEGNEGARLFIPKEHTNTFTGKEVALFLEESDDGDTLIVELSDPETIIIEGQVTEEEETK